MTAMTAERVEERTTYTAANGLEVTRTESIDAKGRRCTAERCEAFVVDVVANLRGVRKGTTAYLWRTTYPVSDFACPAQGEVSINGFGNGGNQAISFHDDAEAARHVRTRRDAHGRPLRAADDPDYERARKRYAEMMAR